jgi:hypothetical protein
MMGSTVSPLLSRWITRTTKAGAVFAACLMATKPVAADDFCYFDFDRPKYTAEVNERVLGVWSMVDVSVETRDSSGFDLTPQSFVSSGSTLEFTLQDGELSAKDDLGARYLVNIYEGSDLNFSDMLTPFTNRSTLSDGTPVSSYRLLPSGMLSALCDSGFLPVISLEIETLPADGSSPVLGPRTFIFVKKSSQFGGFTVDYTNVEPDQNTYSRAFFWLLRQ